MIYGQIDSNKGRYDIWIMDRIGQVDKQTDGQSDRQIDRQLDRQADRYQKDSKKFVKVKDKSLSKKVFNLHNIIIQGYSTLNFIYN